MEEEIESNTFVNPSNGYQESIPALAPLWTLLFGAIYLAVKRLWAHALISLVLAIPTIWIVYIVYAFMVKGMLRKQYLRAGWIPIEEYEGEEVEP